MTPKEQISVIKITSRFVHSCEYAVMIMLSHNARNQGNENGAYDWEQQAKSIKEEMIRRGLGDPLLQLN